MRGNSKAITKIKNNLHYAFGYNVFFMSNIKPLSLPDRLYYMLEAKLLWYVIITAQVVKWLGMQWKLKSIDYQQYK